MDDNVVSEVLGQWVGKRFNVIYYASHTLTSAQRNYAKNDIELYASIFATEKFTPYITYTKVIFYTNHQAIKEVLDIKETKPCWMRWSLLLQEFNSEILDHNEINEILIDALLLEE